MGHFTEEQIQIAKTTDLVNLLEHLGYTTKRIGTLHTCKEMDSIRIYNRNTWHRFSTGYQGKGGMGGDPIDFLTKIEGKTFQDAVDELLNFNHYTDKQIGADHKQPVVSSSCIQTKKQFVLPQKADTYRRTYAYLIKTRGIGKEVVDYFVRNHLIYESADKHNVVFVSTDCEGVARHAFMRGTNEAYPFKGDVEGNDKNYGFNYATESSELNVFEAAIDLMSYMTLTKDFTSNSLALGMLADNPLERFLLEHPNVKTIHFYLDNDKYGKEATEKYIEKYRNAGYRVDDCTRKFVTETEKDINEHLVNVRKASTPIKRPKGCSR